MKSKFDFINSTDVIFPETIIDQKERYERALKGIEEKEIEIEKYTELAKKEYSKGRELNFREQLELYKIIDNFLSEQFCQKSSTMYMGIDLRVIKKRILESFEEVKKYYDLIEQRNSYKNYAEEILSKSITFYYFGNSSKYTDRCSLNHCLVRLKDELVCMCCGATTKDYYDLNLEELDFLTLCALEQNILLKEVKEEDIPLLKVLLMENDYYRSQRKQVDVLSEDDEDRELATEYLLIDEEEILDLRRKIRKAQKLDIRDFEGLPKVRDPKYLSNKRKQQLLSEIKEQTDEIKQLNTRFKKMLLEECKIAKYEVLILSGENIPLLYNSLDNDDDKFALIKAYYNLSNQDYRINCGYFNTPNEAVFYDCRTAHPEINQKILELKLNR